MGLFGNSAEQAVQRERQALARFLLYAGHRELARAVVHGEHLREPVVERAAPPPWRPQYDAAILPDGTVVPYTRRGAQVVSVQDGKCGQPVETKTVTASPAVLVHLGGRLGGATGYICVSPHPCPYHPPGHQA